MHFQKFSKTKLACRLLIDNKNERAIQAAKKLTKKHPPNRGLFLFMLSTGIPARNATRIALQAGESPLAVVGAPLTAIALTAQFIYTANPDKKKTSKIQIKKIKINTIPITFITVIFVFSVL